MLHAAAACFSSAASRELSEAAGDLTNKVAVVGRNGKVHIHPADH